VEAFQARLKEQKTKERLMKGYSIH